MGYFYMLLLSSDFFSKLAFSKILSGALTEYQTLLTLIRTDTMSVLIQVKTVCKCYQQMTKVAASKKMVKSSAYQMLKSFCAVVAQIFFSDMLKHKKGKRTPLYLAKDV